MKGLLLIGSYSSNIEKELEMGKKLVASAGLELEAANVNDISVIAENEFNGKIITRNGAIDCPDIVIVGLLSESHDYHSKAVLRMFDSLGVLCINSIETMEKTSDKLVTFQIANKAVPEIRIPKTMLVTSNTTAEQIIAFTGLPVVLKIMHGSMGKGISLVHDEKSLKDMLSMIFAAPFDDQIIAQQAITSSKGRDIRLIVMNGHVIHSFVRCNDNDFKSNVKKGGHLEDFDAPDDLKRMSEKLAKAMNLKMGSVDYLFGENKDEFYLCEANSMPGMTYLFEAQENGHPEIIKKFISSVAEMIEEHKKDS